MRKLLMFFAGLLLLFLTFVTLYFSGALYDATDKRGIDAFIFQPNNLSTDRIGQPVPLHRLSDTFIREKLIKKFVVEYFHVAPDVENIAQRTRGNSILAVMSAPDVFKDWKNTEAVEIEKLAGNKVLRMVIVGDEIIRKGDYWQIYYQLKTWDKPNNMDLVPFIESGTVSIKLYPEFKKELLETLPNGQEFDVQKYLNSGGDPAAIFKFRVSEVWR
jgi:hypothetical protein